MTLSVLGRLGMASGAIRPTIGLLANNGSISFATLVSIAQALQTQVTSHLQPIWGLDASIVAFPNTQSLTPGAWPIIFVNGLPPGQEGYHLLSNDIPSAFVEASGQPSLFASHECLEMIVDPGGRSRLNGPRPGGDMGQTVQFLLEICDPCISYGNAYQIGPNWVADFVTPDYYAPQLGATRFSFTGKVPGPATLMPYGYLTWYSPSQNQWYQQSADAQGVVSENEIDLPNIQNLPARMVIDRIAAPHRAAPIEASFQKQSRKIAAAYRQEARGYGEQVANLICNHLIPGAL